MKQLKTDLKTKKFMRAYLLYGDEKYLVHYYEKQLKDKILPPGSEMMNCDVFEGKSATVEQIKDAAVTLPFLNEYRLVLLRDSKLFAAGRKDDSEKMASFLPLIPENTVMIFVEEDVDKRGRMYKKINELGRPVEFLQPSEKELTDWVVNMFMKRGKVISKETTLFLLRTIGRSMDALAVEIEKLTAYADEQIQTTDIAAICAPALETRIFDLVDAVGNQNPNIALDIFANMLVIKEPPIVILAMIIRQFRLMIQCKILHEKGGGTSAIANQLSLRSFMVAEFLRQSRNFSVAKLSTALEDCLETDINIKMGRINDRIAMETLIVKYAVKCPCI